MTYLTRCVSCRRATTKVYSRAHEGKCKSCVTGAPQVRNNLHVCPECGERRLTSYQKAHHYHCDACTRLVETEGGVYGY